MALLGLILPSASFWIPTFRFSDCQSASQSGQSEVPFSDRLSFGFFSLGSRLLAWGARNGGRMARRGTIGGGSDGEICVWTVVMKGLLRFTSRAFLQVDRGNRSPGQLAGGS